MTTGNPKPKHISRVRNSSFNARLTLRQLMKLRAQFCAPSPHNPSRFHLAP
jgi:hypothetical protein